MAHGGRIQRPPRCDTGLRAGVFLDPLTLLLGLLSLLLGLFVLFFGLLFGLLHLLQRLLLLLLSLVVAVICGEAAAGKVRWSLGQWQTDVRQAH
jgi:hypothetical protein